MQRILNYGSMLQAYGLKNMIESLGHNVVFVDYQPAPCINPAPPKFVAFIRKVFRRLMNILRGTNKEYERNKTARIQIHRAILEAQSVYLGISHEVRYRSHVDTLVIGSDEVFNCLQNNPDVGYSPELFGSGRRSKRLISYAASFGNTTIERLYSYGAAGEVGQYLSEFDAISVRDKNSGTVVNSLLKKEPLYHLDPVLIYDYSRELSKLHPISLSGYIIVYAYEGRIQEHEAAVISAFARKHSKKTLCIGAINNFCDEFIPASPFEVLSYFKNADYVVTDTFHGSIMSIKYNKPFAAIIRETKDNDYGNSEKLTDLLERFALTGRIVRDISLLEDILSSDIDFTASNSLIEQERLRSMEYLKKFL